MTTIKVTEPKHIGEEEIVRMTCDCLWYMDTFKKGYISCAFDHFVEKHGGEGFVTYDGDTVHFMNGTVDNVNLHNYD